jgi:hypothetical protein
VCLFFFQFCDEAEVATKIPNKKNKIQQGKMKVLLVTSSCFLSLSLSLFLSYLNLVGCELNMLIYKINMFSSKENGTMFGLLNTSSSTHTS